MLVGLACLALGIPGKNRLKMNLFWAAMAWSTLPLFISAIYTYEYNEMPVPDILSMGMNLFFLLTLALWGRLYYAFMEKERDIFFAVVDVMFIVAAVLTVSVEYFYAFEQKGRLWLPGVVMVYMDIVILFHLIRTYRNAPLQSTLRKRIRVIFLNLFYLAICLFTPFQAALTMGLFPDPIVAQGWFNVLFVLPSVVCFGIIITRYNLVKVELDQVGEGLFRDIDSPVLLLSKEQAILRSNPKADALFPIQEMMSQPEELRKIQNLLPDFRNLPPTSMWHWTPCRATKSSNASCPMCTKWMKYSEA